MCSQVFFCPSRPHASASFPYILNKNSFIVSDFSICMSISGPTYPFGEKRSPPSQAKQGSLPLRPSSRGEVSKNRRRLFPGLHRCMKLSVVPTTWAGRTVPNVQLGWYVYGAHAWWHGSVGRSLRYLLQTVDVDKVLELCGFIAG